MKYDFLLKKGKFARLASSTVFLLLPILSNASGILYQFNTPFPSDPSPSGPTPWLTADFENSVGGGVTLTISAAGLTGSEFASEMYFNIDSYLNQNSLIFTKTASTGSFSTPTIDQAAGDNNYKADGDGKYDFRFDFGTANGTTFGSGDSITYQIGGILGLVANNFAFMSAPAGGSGPFYAAAHIQSLSNGGSTWIEPGGGPVVTPVPEPSSETILGGLSLIALLIVHLGRKSQFQAVDLSLNLHGDSVRFRGGTNEIIGFSACFYWNSQTGYLKKYRTSAFS